MVSLHECRNLIIAKRGSASGYSLIEMMIVLALVGIVVVAVITSQSTQTKSFSTQQSVAKIQQDLHGAMYMLQYDLMNTGRDPSRMMRYNIEDLHHYDPYNPGNVMNPPGDFPANRPIGFPAQQLFTSFPVLQFKSLRWDSDGDGIGDQPMTIRYQVYDFDNDGRLDLGRSIAVNGGPMGPPELVAEGVIAFGYVCAYDSDPDGHYKLDRGPAPPPPPAPAPPLKGSVIWAVDTTGDGSLDFNADTTGDGRITPADDISGEGIIGFGDGAMLPKEIDPKYIRAIKISVLLQSARPSEGAWIDRNQYVVGNRVIPPNNQKRFNDSYRRRLRTITVALRNFQKA